MDIPASDYSEQKLRRINRYEGVIVDVTVDRVALPGGNESLREVVHHPGGVAVLPLGADGTVYCVRQFRYPFARHLLEIPAGKLEPGEQPRASAIRELGEETGFTAGKLVALGSIYTSPGFSTEELHLYLATELVNGDAHPDENEFLDVVPVPLAELTELALSGELRDGKTVTAVLKAARLLELGRV